MAHKISSLVALCISLYILSSCQTIRPGRSIASIARVGTGDEIVCDHENFRVKFSQDLILSQPQAVEVSFGPESNYSAELNFTNAMSDIRVDNCDDNQCWKTRTLLETYNIGVDGSLAGRFEYEVNGKALFPKVVKCKLVKQQFKF